MYLTTYVNLQYPIFVKNVTLSRLIHSTIKIIACTYSSIDNLKTDNFNISITKQLEKTLS